MFPPNTGSPHRERASSSCGCLAAIDHDDFEMGVSADFTARLHASFSVMTSIFPLL